MHTWSSVPLDALTAGYLFAFVVGAAFSVVSWIFACARRGGRVRARGASPSAAAAPRAGQVLRGLRGLRASRAGTLSRVCAPLADTSAWAAMLCVGGGLGYLLRVTGHSAPVSVAVALPAGLAAGYLLGAMVEMLAQDTRYAARAASAGTVCTVLSRIAASGTGQVMFVHAGAHRALPAMSASGEAIDRGTEVMVVEVQSGIARVMPMDRVLVD